MAVQSANGTNSAEDRAALDKEVQQRLSEITRIASQTSFNGKNVLDGSAGVTKFQVGSEVGQTIDLNLTQSVKADQLGTYSKTSAKAVGTALTFTGDLTTVAASTIDIGGKTATIAAGDYSAQTLQAAINGAFNKAGISNAVATVDAVTSKVTVETRVNLSQSGAAASDGDITSSDLGLSDAAASTTDGQKLNSADIKTVDGANDMMASIDSALQTISDMRSDLGAVQNRFESTISNLQTISQNLSASRSQILDADFASETANMTSANILQQAGVSVLAQANASTQSVLKLLQ
ncbi:MAG: flagellin [Rhodanobacter sp.]